MKDSLLELYSDYLMSSFVQTTATGLSQLLDHEVSHDQNPRLLAGAVYTSRDLWSLVKPTVRSIEVDDGVLIFDDTLEEKPYTDENEIIAWHVDHCQNRTVKRSPAYLRPDHDTLSKTVERRSLPQIY